MVQVRQPCSPFAALRACRSALSKILNIPDDCDQAVSEIGSASSRWEAVPIDFQFASTCICLMCGSSAANASPLQTPSAMAAGEGRIQWAKYRPIYAGDADDKGATSRRPYGKQCAICRNVFNALGLEDRFGTIRQYYTHACKPENAAEFRLFMTSRSEWIVQHNGQNLDADVRDHLRIKGAKELKARFTTLATTKSDKVSFEGPEFEFVTSEAFNPKLDGEWDPAKVTCHFILGAKREGIWILRGREGVFKSKQKESTGSKQETVEDDGGGPFAQQRLENKMLVINGAKAKFEKERSQKCIVKPLATDAVNMLDLLVQAGVGQQASNHQAEQEGSRRSSDPTGSGALRCKVESDESGDDEDVTKGAPASRLASLFSSLQDGPRSGAGGAIKAPLPASRAARAITGASGNVAARASGHVAASQAEAKPEPRSDCGAGARVGRERPPASASVSQALFDGRTRRIIESLTSSAQAIEISLESISFDEDLDCNADKTKKHQLSDLLKAKGRKIAKIQGDVNSALQRIKSSASQGALEEIRDRFQTLSEKALLIMKFHQIVATASPEPEQFSRHVWRLLVWASHWASRISSSI